MKFSYFCKKQKKTLCFKFCNKVENQPRKMTHTNQKDHKTYGRIFGLYGCLITLILYLFDFYIQLYDTIAIDTA